MIGLVRHVYYSTVGTKLISRVEKLLATHALDLFLCTQGILLCKSNRYSTNVIFRFGRLTMTYYNRYENHVNEQCQLYPPPTHLIT